MNQLTKAKLNISIEYSTMIPILSILKV